MMNYCRMVGAMLLAGANAVGFAEDVVCPVSDDTMIYSRSFDVDVAGNKNAGKNVDILAGANGKAAYYRSLVRFPLETSGLTAADVVAAKLVLTVSGNDKMKVAGGVPVAVYCVHGNNAGWTEGSVQYSYAKEGEACWEALGRNRTPWYGEPGIGTGCGVSCKVASVTVAKGTVTGTIVEFPLSADALVVVKGWIGGEPNAGFLLMSEDEANNTQNAVKFASNDNTSYAQPKLVLTLKDGPTVEVADSEDLFLLSNVAPADDKSDWNWGGRNCVVVGAPEKISGVWQPSRGLLRFDCSSAAGLCVTGATLRLVVSSTGETDDPVTLHVREMFAADAAWREGAKVSSDKYTGALADDGDMTWNYLARNEQTWSEGAVPPSGVRELASVTFEHASSVKAGDVLDIPLEGWAAIGLIRQWADGGDNAGLLLKTDEATPTDDKKASLYFGSKEHANAVYRSQLILHTCPAESVSATSSADGFFYDGSDKYKANEWGGAATLIAGLNNSAANTYRAILRFDGLAGAYTRSRCAQEAMLALTVSAVAKKGTGTFDVRLHLLDDRNAGWGEGTNPSGGTATGETACWNLRNASGTAWVGGAGIGIDDTSDGIDTTVATVTVDASELELGQTILFPITDADALARIDRWATRTGAANAGFYVTTDESSGKMNALQFAAREHETEAWRPKLTVYTVPREQRGLTLIFR